MIFIVRLISRTFGQNVSKAALFELSLKKLFAETAHYTFSLKKLFSQKNFSIKKLFSQNLCFVIKPQLQSFLREKFSKSFHHFSVNISRNEPIFTRPFA